MRVTEKPKSVRAAVLSADLERPIAGREPTIKHPDEAERPLQEWIVPGSAAGLTYWMAEDFNDPLDFEDQD
jgi:hypothetical protein